MLATAGVEHDIMVFPDAGHGFLNDHDPAELPLWVKAIAKLVAGRLLQAVGPRRAAADHRFLRRPPQVLTAPGGLEAWQPCALALPPVVRSSFSFKTAARPCGHPRLVV